MALENLAVQGMTVDIVDGSVPGLSATLVVSTLPTDEIKCDGKNQYLDGTVVIGTAFTSTSNGTAPGPVNGTLNTTTTVNFNHSTALLRENDETNTLQVTLTLPGPPPVQTIATFKYKVTDANQDRVVGL
jgi:hypothetical protein